MVTIRLPAQLRALTDGESPLLVDGSDVAEVIHALERRHPRTRGWITDETGKLRPHVKVFVNGEMADFTDTVSENDEVHVLPAISGGEDVTELLIGTRKGLIVLRGARGGPMEVAARAFPGQEVEYALRDPRSGLYYASVTHGQFGPRMFLTSDPAGDWEQTDGPAFPKDADAAVARIWTIEPGIEDGVLWAGVDPAALFRSEDEGRTWSLNRALWDVPDRPQWEPGGGGLCLHSICPWPDDPSRLAVGISAAGVWMTEDGGQSWHRGGKGLVPRYLPDEARTDAPNLCIHDLQRSPIDPSTMYLQFHGGVYRSDDAGETWIDIGTDSGLPSDFGFPLVVHPRIADRALVIPLDSDMDRVTPEGKVRVFETCDAGQSWTALSRGLPQENAFLVVLRQAFCHDGKEPLGLFFGATSGDVFASGDDGATWSVAASRLPPILSVRSAY